MRRSCYDRLHLRPGCLLKERLPWFDFNRPISNGNPDVIQPSTCNLCNILFGLRWEYKQAMSSMTELLTMKVLWWSSIWLRPPLAVSAVIASLSVHSSEAWGYFWKSAGAMKGSKTNSPPRLTLIFQKNQFEIRSWRGIAHTRIRDPYPMSNSCSKAGSMNLAEHCH